MMTVSGRGVPVPRSAPPTCCPWVTAERVRFWLHHIRMARLSHFDPVEAARSVASPRGERHMGRSGAIGPAGSHAESECIAVIQAMPIRYTLDQLQRWHADPTEIMRSLCPESVS